MTLSTKVFALGYLILVGILLGVWLISMQHGIPVQHFTGDPSKVFETHPFIGFLSNIGILFWCGTATICFFTFSLIGKELPLMKRRFILFSGLFTLFLLIDDLFMFHEEVFPFIFHTSHKRIMAAYVLLALGFLFFFRKTIFENHFPVFLLAGFFLGGSVVMDMLFPNEGLQHLFEDGFKLLGIFTWMIYFIMICGPSFEEVRDSGRQ
jgi:hypothetical protein